MARASVSFPFWKASQLRVICMMAAICAYPHASANSSPARGVLQRIVIVAHLAQAAAGPEVGDGQKLGVVHFVFERCHEAEMRGRAVEILLGHRQRAFRHAQMQIVEEGQGGPDWRGEFRHQTLQKLRTVEAGIHPLGDEPGQHAGTAGERFHLRPDAFQGVQALRDAAVSEVIAQLREQPLEIAGDCRGILWCHYGSDPDHSSALLHRACPSGLLSHLLAIDEETHS